MSKTNSALQLQGSYEDHNILTDIKYIVPFLEKLDDILM